MRKGDCFMWKKWLEMARGFMTRERMKKMGWYGALGLLLVILGAGSHAYRNRRAAPEIDVPRAAMAVGTPQPLEALFVLPTSSPGPTPEPVAFAWPLDGEIIGEYAPEELVWSETMGQWQSHPGIDIAAAAGEAVTSCADGTVSAAWEDPLWGYVIEITHREGYVSTYANLSTLNMVKEGDAVEAGQVIGAVGDTADCESDMPWHLHFSLTRNGNPVDFRKTVVEG